MKKVRIAYAIDYIRLEKYSLWRIFWQVLSDHYFYMWAKFPKKEWLLHCYLTCIDVKFHKLNPIQAVKAIKYYKSLDK